MACGSRMEIPLAYEIKDQVAGQQLGITHEVQCAAEEGSLKRI